MFKTVTRACFITLKDHKEDFSYSPNVKLIKPTKTEVGRVAMKILDNVVKKLREMKETNYVQAISTKGVLDQFKSLKVKEFLKFIN